jgi:cytidylate kinase
MPIITISRGSYSMGKEVAESVAERLGYTCISREVLLAASKRFSVPEVKLLHAIHNAPTLLEKFGHNTTSYQVYIQAALLDHVRHDNVVYHGLAGHILLKDIDAVLRVRLLADLETRVSVVSKRQKLTRKDATALILRIDRERRAWTRKLHGADPLDSSLYDLVISIEKIGVPGASDLICRAVAHGPFELNETVKRKIDNLSLACGVKSHLLDIDDTVKVSAQYGNVLVHTKATDLGAGRFEEKVRWIQENVEGINNIEVRTSAAKLRSDR